MHYFFNVHYKTIKSVTHYNVGRAIIIIIFSFFYMLRYNTLSLTVLTKLFTAHRTHNFSMFSWLDLSNFCNEQQYIVISKLQILFTSKLYSNFVIFKISPWLSETKIQTFIVNKKNPKPQIFHFWVKHIFDISEIKLTSWHKKKFILSLLTGIKLGFLENHFF